MRTELERQEAARRILQRVGTPTSVEGWHHHLAALKLERLIYQPLEAGFGLLGDDIEPVDAVFPAMEEFRMIGKTRMKESAHEVVFLSRAYEAGTTTHYTIHASKEVMLNARQASIVLETLLKTAIRDLERRLSE